MRRLIRCGMLAVALSAGAAVGHAQDVRPERPYRGLFASRDQTNRTGHTLDIDWSLLGAYDDNVTADVSNVADPRFMVNGVYGNANSGLTYRARGEHSVFEARGIARGRYYPDLRSLTSLDGAGNVSFTGDFGQKTHFRASQRYSYQPYYQLSFFDALAPSIATTQPTGDSALTSSKSQDFDGVVGVDYNISRRSSLELEYSYRRTQFVADDQHFAWQIGKATFKRNLTKNLGVRLGYGYGVADNTFETVTPRMVTHNIDAGFDYGRSLSFSRRTRLSFASGSAVVTTSGGQHQPVVTGDVRLSHELSRTWSTEAYYHRGVQFLPGFADAMVADSVNVALGGFINRRIKATTTAGYSTGTIGQAADHGYNTYTAVADLGVALTRMLSFSAQYAYYHYDFERAARLPLDLPYNLNRQGLRFGLSGWLPLSR